MIKSPHNVDNSTQNHIFCIKNKRIFVSEDNPTSFKNRVVKFFHEGLYELWCFNIGTDFLGIRSMKASIAFEYDYMLS